MKQIKADLLFDVGFYILGIISGAAATLALIGVR